MKKGIHILIRGDSKAKEPHLEHKKPTRNETEEKKTKYSPKRIDKWKQRKKEEGWEGKIIEEE